jgi:hypothetical protein
MYPRFRIRIMHIGTAFRVQLFHVIWFLIHNINFNRRTNMGVKKAFLKLHLIIISIRIFSLVKHSDLTSVLDTDPAKVSDLDPAKVLNPDLAKVLNPDLAKILVPDPAKVLYTDPVKVLDPAKVSDPA